MVEQTYTPIAERQQEMVDSFAILGDWEDKYRLIIDMGRKLPEFPEEHRTEENKVKGCQSQVWFHASLDGDRVKFVADSDAAIVRGLIAILLKTYSGAPPERDLGSIYPFLERYGFGGAPFANEVKRAERDGEADQVLRAGVQHLGRAEACCRFFLKKPHILLDLFETAIGGE